MRASGGYWMPTMPPGMSCGADGTPLWREIHAFRAFPCVAEETVALVTLMRAGYCWRRDVGQGRDGCGVAWGR